MPDRSPPARPVPSALDVADRIAARFGAVPGVVAVAVGGSRASGAIDDDSDIDLYVYATGEVPTAVRGAVASSRRELDQRFWEPGDSWIDAATGLTIDVIYRSPTWIEAELDRLLVHHQASVGYSTCIWFNVLASTPLVDRAGWFAGLRQRARQPYPEPLRRAIIAKNHPLLRSAMFSFLHQIETALRRRDAVAVHHRLTALLASYFDVLFALNRQPHPGEKRLVERVGTLCPRQPTDFPQRLEAVLRAAPPPWEDRALLRRTEELIDAIDALLPADP